MVLLMLSISEQLTASSTIRLGREIRRWLSRQPRPDTTDQLNPRLCRKPSPMVNPAGGMNGLASRHQRRQRRQIERRLRELDRLDQRSRTGRIGRSTTGDWRGRFAILVTILLSILIVFTVPGLAPVWLRQAVGLGPDRLSDPVVTSTSGSYAFIAHQVDAKTPVTWDPCRPIHYVVNTKGAPPGTGELLEQAVVRIQNASGLQFEYDGETGARPKWDSPVLPILGVRRPVLISWATSNEVRQLAGDVAGIGGAVPVRTSNGPLRFATGGVTLDEDAFAELATRPGGRAEERAIILHELGHLLGLAHVSDPVELMNGDNVGRLDFGPGDLAGLARLGLGPCF